MKKRRPRRVNLEVLREKIKGLKPGIRLYRVLKEELSVLGYWRNRKRGNPVKGFEVMMGRIKAREEAKKEAKRDELL